MKDGSEVGVKLGPIVGIRDGALEGRRVGTAVIDVDG